MLEVLRGGRRTGEIVEDAGRWTGWMDPDARGRTCLFLEPDPDGVTMQPFFEVLGPEYADEVRFLLDEKREAKDLARAIRLLQGASNESRAAGLDYLKAHREGASKAVSDAIGSERERLLREKEVYEEGWVLSNLVEALLLSPDAEAEEFLAAPVEAFASRPWPDVPWGEIPKRPGPFGHFLRIVLARAAGAAGGDGDPPARPVRLEEIRSRLRRALFARLKDMGSLGVAEAAYALVASGAASPEAIAPLLATAEARDGFALGLSFAADDSRRVWSWDRAFALWRAAAAAASREELAARIRGEMGKWKEHGKPAGPAGTPEGL